MFTFFKSLFFSVEIKNLTPNYIMDPCYILTNPKLGIIGSKGLWKTYNDVCGEHNRQDLYVVLYVDSYTFLSETSSL